MQPWAHGEEVIVEQTAAAAAHNMGGGHCFCAWRPKPWAGGRFLGPLQRSSENGPIHVAQAGVEALGGPLQGGTTVMPFAGLGDGWRAAGDEALVADRAPRTI